jgi:hypothetical protein
MVENPCAGQHPKAGPLGLTKADASQPGEIARHERQHARGKKRDDAGQKGRAEADIEAHGRRTPASRMAPSSDAACGMCCSTVGLFVMSGSDFSCWPFPKGWH